MKHRSAITGKAVTEEFAEANRDTTILEGKSSDTERLDWLEESHADLTYLAGREPTSWWLEFSDRCIPGRTPREAIDSAMKSEASGRVLNRSRSEKRDRGE